MGLQRNHNNVYSGPDSIRSYFDPECHPPLPLVEIPDCLNPFRADGVRIYAKMMSMHPATNVKVIPAMNLLDRGVVPGETKTIVESSSGSTVISMAMVARAFHGIDDVHAYLSNKTSATKVKLMQFFGLQVSLFGGPAQPTPADERGGICAAARKAQESKSVCSPNQYRNDDNWQAHVRWTGPQIFAQLPEIDVIAASMGTSGTMTGLGTYFKTAKPSVYRLAVCTNEGDRVPGPREFSLMSTVQFPYKDAMDGLEGVGATDSYSLSLDLTRQGLVCGPSSGFTLAGLFQMLQKKKDDGSLSKLAGPSGDINCVFMCCDLPYQYLNEYFEKLGPEKFHPVHNQHLQNFDKYPYHDAWELPASQAMAGFFTQRPLDAAHSTASSFATASLSELSEVFIPKTKCQILDFRRSSDFDALHLPNSISIPLKALAQGSSRGSPFADPVGDVSMLEEVWTELEGLFGATDPSASALMAILRGNKVLTLCYDGDSARVANSVLRAKGVHAESVYGGYKALGSIELPRSFPSHVVSSTVDPVGS